ncbi:hypothetical protein FD754_023730 [Muntiacus muntjak]|uniref:NR LBD domain-containing protein n=1 Tax=Muntiacus muntjak TaxID=9888 RepID=A0A5N3USD8_MUNMU|nr:hypothetical protein FD754_023730 [Muntiacus muntjak]
MLSRRGGGEGAGPRGEGRAQGRGGGAGPCAGWGQGHPGPGDLGDGWNELLIASFSHRSIAVKDGILLATGLHVHRNSAHSAGVGAIFDRVLTELVSKMRDMQMDKTELGCLRAIVLFNPDSKGLSNPAEVEALREKVYASLEAYCKHKYPEQPGRFAKLLLRLPALRSIGLKCLEHLFFFKLIGDTPIDTFLMEMLEAPHQMT